MVGYNYQVIIYGEIELQAKYLCLEPLPKICLHLFTLVID